MVLGGLMFQVRLDGRYTFSLWGKEFYVYVVDAYLESNFRKVFLAVWIRRSNIDWI